MKKRYAFSLKNCLSFTLLGALICFFSPISNAQNGPAVQWDKTFGGNGKESLNSIQQTSDGGFILGGTSFSGISGDKTQPSKGGNDYWIIKTDITGNKLWEKVFGGSDDDNLYFIQQTFDGGYILGGESFSGISGDKSQSSKGSYDCWVIKLDSNGNKIWDKTIGGSASDGILEIKQTSDGGYIFGAHSSSGISGDKSQNSQGMSDFWVVKLDVNGNKLWDKSFGGNGHEFISTLEQTSDGGYILGGPSNSNTSSDKTQSSKGAFDYWVIKIDGGGNKIWDKTLGGLDHDEIYCLKQTSDGGYILGGRSMSGISGDKSQPSWGADDCWLVKLDANGNKMWDKSFGGNSSDAIMSLQLTVDGGFILGGQSSSGVSGDKSQPCLGNNDYWLIKVNNNGTLIWEKTIGGMDNDRLFKVHQTSDNGFILGGYSNSGIGADKTQASQGNFDFWIVKLAPDVLGINETEAGLNFSLSPNPSQGKFSLNLIGLTAPTAEITVTDLLGRKVHQQQFKTTNAQLSEEIKLPTAAKGMYLLQVKAGQQTISRKIVVE